MEPSLDSRFQACKPNGPNPLPSLALGHGQVVEYFIAGNGIIDDSGSAKFADRIASPGDRERERKRRRRCKTSSFGSILTYRGGDIQKCTKKPWLKPDRLLAFAGESNQKPGLRWCKMDFGTVCLLLAG